MVTAHPGRRPFIYTNLLLGLILREGRINKETAGHRGLAELGWHLRLELGIDQELSGVIGSHEDFF